MDIPNKVQHANYVTFEAIVYDVSRSLLWWLSVGTEREIRKTVC